MTMYFRSHIFCNLRFGAFITAAALFILSLSNVVSAQTTSTIEGTVTDKQGLAVSAAEVRAESPTLAASRRVTTDANGSYQIPGLPAGVYLLTVTHDGFSTRVFEGLELTLNRTLNFDMKLEIGKVQER